jgi:hypothetical protein
MNKEERQKLMKSVIHPSPVYIDGIISWNISIDIDLETEKEALEYAKLLVKTTPLPIVPQTKLYNWWKKFRD